MLAILAEKPSAARNMIKAFGGKTGTFENEQFEICNAIGHLYEFKAPEDQVDPALKAKYHSWLLTNMPWDPADFAWSYAKKDGVSDALAAIKETFKKCDEIVIATDDDPSGEGALLAAEIIINLGFDRNRKISRMFFADESAAKLQEAFRKRKRFKSVHDDPDYAKALYRTKWDFLSMQFTRAATKLGDGKSVLRQGRLKSAMVLLVGDQLAKCAAYKKTPYYQYKFKDGNGNVFSWDGEPRFPDKNSVPKGKYQGSAVIAEETARKKTAPPKLIDLASLAARLAPKGFKAQDVLNTYQRMYEAQVVSYPRTEDKAVTIEQFKELLPLCDDIARVIGVDPALLTNKSPRPGFVKEGMAHGANRPGPNVPKSMSDLAQYGKCAEDIYYVLATSYLAMLCADYEYDAQEAHLEKYPDFRSRVNKPAAMGWKAVYNDDADPDDEENAAGFGTSAEPFVYEGFPPKPQSPTFKWLKNQLDKADIGTGATRTSTYAEVTNEKSKYPLMKDSKGRISMTQFGDMSYRLLPGTHIGTLEITAHVFDDMVAIAKGEKDPDECLKEVARLVLDDIEAMKINGEKMRKELNIMAETEQAERFEGTWAKTGEEVHPKRTWSGHRFTDEECEKLLAGEEITIEATSAKTGKPFRCKGKLSEQEYNGNSFVGFERTEFVNDGPTSWCKYQFTDDEKKALKAGKTVKGSKFVGKTGKAFKAEVKWNDKEQKIEVVEFIK